MMYATVIDPPRWANLSWAPHNGVYHIREVQILDPEDNHVDAFIIQQIEGTYTITVWPHDNASTRRRLEPIDIAAALILRYPDPYPER